MSDRCTCYDTLVVKDLNRWFKEKWVDVSRKDPKTGKHPPCGRSKAKTSSKGYPKCRPSVKVSDKTPKTSGQMTSGEKQAATKRKRAKRQGVGGKPTIVKEAYPENQAEYPPSLVSVSNMLGTDFPQTCTVPGCTNSVSPVIQARYANPLRSIDYTHYMCPEHADMYDFQSMYQRSEPMDIAMRLLKGPQFVLQDAHLPPQPFPDLPEGAPPQNVAIFQEHWAGEEGGAPPEGFHERYNLHPDAKVSMYGIGRNASQGWKPGTDQLKYIDDAYARQFQNKLSQVSPDATHIIVNTGHSYPIGANLPQGSNINDVQQQQEGFPASQARWERQQPSYEAMLQSMQPEMIQQGEPMDIAWRLLKTRIASPDENHPEIGRTVYNPETNEVLDSSVRLMPTKHGRHNEPENFIRDVIHEDMHTATLPEVGQSGNIAHAEFPAFLGEEVYSQRLAEEGKSERRREPYDLERTTPFNQALYRVSQHPNVPAEDREKAKQLWFNSIIQTGEPMDIALQLLKNPVSPEAKRHKIEYDKKYESNPERVKYREELNAERRKRGIYGHGGPDMSHTKRHTLVAESPHANRARHFKSRGTLK